MAEHLSRMHGAYAACLPESTSNPKSNFEIQASRTKGEFDGSSVNIVGM